MLLDEHSLEMSWAFLLIKESGDLTKLKIQRAKVFFSTKLRLKLLAFVNEGKGKFN